MRKLLTLIACSCALAAPLSAHALDFDFSFSNTIGTTPGTVTGEIFGLTDNATSSPTDVIVTGYPAARGGLPPAPWDIYTIPGFVFGEHGTPLVADHFTVSNGVVTDAVFSVFTATNQVVLQLGYGGLDDFANPVGLPGIPSGIVIADASTDIFSRDTGGVPEPSAWGLMIGGLFGVGAVLRRRAAGAAVV